MLEVDARFILHGLAFRSLLWLERPGLYKPGDMGHINDAELHLPLEYLPELEYLSWIDLDGKGRSLVGLLWAS